MPFLLGWISAAHPTAGSFFSEDGGRRDVPARLAAAPVGQPLGNGACGPKRVRD